MLNPSTASISSGPRTKPGHASARSKSAQVARCGAKVLVSCWNPPTAMRGIYFPFSHFACHTGESRYPLIRCPSGWKVGPGFRRDDNEPYYAASNGLNGVGAGRIDHGNTRGGGP